MELMMFAKLLQPYPLAETAQIVKDMGFDGLDLTVRSNGYVQPEDAVQGVPQAVEVCARHGLEVPMLTTEIISAEQEYAEDIFAAAAQCGVRWLKLGYWRYEKFGELQQEISAAREEMVGLEALAREYGVWAGAHIHSSTFLSAVPAQLYQILMGRDPQYVGAYIDPGHMVVEGAASGWKMGIDLLAPYIQLVAVKDVMWLHKPTADNPKNYQLKLVPLADGMVPWPEVFSLLHQIGFDGGISVHSEYGSYMNTEEIVAQTRKDVEYLKPLLAQFWPR